ncbi:MAG: MBL fold metallo-hydrolase [Acidobacteria bacterium]|nr:MBL fold metallo-hydrolase [Acidobacteriota bacterium]
MHHRPRLVLAAVLACASCTAAPGDAPGASGGRPPDAPTADRGTRVVFLGTGTPLPDPERSGPSTAVVVGGAAYLFDAGPGVVRRAMAAAARGVSALDSVNLHTAFLTHLHSDHTMGLPDLILTPWVMGRKEPLALYGPPGTAAMAAAILTAWSEDIAHRLDGLQPATPRGYQVNAVEVSAGVAYEDARVKVTAIPVLHGDWQAFAYRIDTADRSIVISGDARPTPALAEACNGCDLLIHEVQTEGSTAKVSPEWQAYRRQYHTTTRELADIARRSRPGLLILYHRANAGCDQVGTDCGTSGSEEEALEEMRRFYDGPVAAAHDLDVF